MPFRFLPRTDNGHLEALETAQRKLDSLSAADPRFVSPATETRLGELLPQFREEVTGRGDVVGQQTNATSAAKRKKQELRLYVRHFFQALNMAIARGKGFQPGDRTYYGLDANQQALPSLRREADLLRVAQTLIDGEAKRVAAGGKRLTMPSAKEIARLLRETRALLTQKKQLVASVDRESEDVDRLRAEVADLVRDIWDELEFAHRKDSPAARRRRCREWGVLYRERRREIESTSEASSSDDASASGGRGGLPLDARGVSPERLEGEKVPSLRVEDVNHDVPAITHRQPA